MRLVAFDIDLCKIDDQIRRKQIVEPSYRHLNYLVPAAWRVIGPGNTATAGITDFDFELDRTNLVRNTQTIRFNYTAKAVEMNRIAVELQQSRIGFEADYPPSLPEEGRRHHGII